LRSLLPKLKYPKKNFYKNTRKPGQHALSSVLCPVGPLSEKHLSWQILIEKAASAL
jgi:hypothetical protein